MNRNANSPFDPFHNSDTSKFVFAKRRGYSNNDPFFFDNDTHEISFNGTIKLKICSRQSNAVNSFETRDKPPFYKGEQTNYCAFKGLNSNDKQSNIANSSERAQPLIIKPNFNIYILAAKISLAIIPSKMRIVLPLRIIVGEKKWIHLTCLTTPPAKRKEKSTK